LPGEKIIIVDLDVRQELILADQAARGGFIDIFQPAIGRRNQGIDPVFIGHDPAQGPDGCSCGSFGHFTDLHPDDLLLVLIDPHRTGCGGERRTGCTCTARKFLVRIDRLHGHAAGGNPGFCRGMRRIHGVDVMENLSRPLVVRVSLGAALVESGPGQEKDGKKHQHRENAQGLFHGRNQPGRRKKSPPCLPDNGEMLSEPEVDLKSVVDPLEGASPRHGALICNCVTEKNHGMA
jgi:hypothetical protein